MYLRFSQRANADGTLVRYVALAHNHRVDGKAKPDVLMNLGRVDRLDVDGLLRLAASIRKHLRRTLRTVPPLPSGVVVRVSDTRGQPAASRHGRRWRDC